MKGTRDVLSGSALQEQRRQPGLRLVHRVRGPKLRLGSEWVGSSTMAVALYSRIWEPVQLIIALTAEFGIGSTGCQTDGMGCHL